MLAAWALSAWIIRNWPNQLSQSHFFLISYLGLLASYSFLPPTLSYNSITLCLASCWLYFFDFPNTKSGFALGTGIILGLLIFVKLPTAILLYGISCLAVSLGSKKIKDKLIQLALILLPYPVLDLMLWATLNDSFFLRFTEAISATLSRPDYSWPILLKINFVGWMWVFIAALPWFFLGRISDTQNAKFYLLVFISISCLLILSWITHITPEWNHVLVLATAACLAFLLGKANWSQLKNPKFLVILGLPFVLHFGSNVYFLRLSIFFVVFWILAAGILWQPSSVKSRISAYTLGSISILFLVFIGIWQAPFGHNQPLWKSQTSYTIPDNSTILIDSALANSLIEIQTRIPEDSQILAAYRNPGIPFLLGKTIPHSPAYWDLSQLEAISLELEHSKLILFSPYDPLPAQWPFRDTLGSWQVSDRYIYLLSH